MEKHDISGNLRNGNCEAHLMGSRTTMMRHNIALHSCLSSEKMSSLGIEKTKEVAAYMRQLYNAELQGKDDVPLPHWSIDLAEDCRYAVKVILKAVKNESEWNSI